MPGDEIHIVVRKPMSDIEADVRRRFSLKTPLLDASLEPDALVLTFAGSTDNPVADLTPRDEVTVSSKTVQGRTVKRRRKHRVRRRTRTRGWDVVGKFVNSHGQSCTIYRPFVEKLAGANLKRREAYSLVRQLIVDNGNDPKPATVEYFLRNTLEYLESRGRSPQ